MFYSQTNCKFASDMGHFPYVNSTTSVNIENGSKKSTATLANKGLWLVQYSQYKRCFKSFS